MSTVAVTMKSSSTIDCAMRAWPASSPVSSLSRMLVSTAREPEIVLGHVGPFGCEHRIDRGVHFLDRDWRPFMLVERPDLSHDLLGRPAALPCQWPQQDAAIGLDHVEGLAGFPQRVAHILGDDHLAFCRKGSLRRHNG